MPSGKSNLVSVFDNSSESERSIYLPAYFRNRDILQGIADIHGVSLEISAGVFSAVSPNNQHMSNLSDTNNLLRAVKSGVPEESISVHTYHANRNKAYRIASGEDPLRVLRGNKTSNFYLNCRFPEDPHPVTVDGHMINVYLNREPIRIQPLNPLDRIHATKSLYHEIANSLREVASQFGLRAHEVQSVIWYTWRRLHGIKFSSQAEMWCPEYLSAGLGYKLVT